MLNLNAIEIDGKEYFEIEGIKGKENTYYYYGNEINPEDFKIFKLKVIDNEDFLEEPDSFELEEAFNLFNAKHRK